MDAETVELLKGLGPWGIVVVFLGKMLQDWMRTSRGPMAAIHKALCEPMEDGELSRVARIDALYNWAFEESKDGTRVSRIQRLQQDHMQQLVKTGQKQTEILEAMTRTLALVHEETQANRRDLSEGLRLLTGKARASGAAPRGRR